MSVAIVGQEECSSVAVAAEQLPQGENNSSRQRKEERRRERRERRNRRLRQRAQTELANQLDAFMYEGLPPQPLPDLLSSHQQQQPTASGPPPPYTTLPPAYRARGEEGGRRGWRAAIPVFYRG